jgi:hypothetical protein
MCDRSLGRNLRLLAKAWWLEHSLPKVKVAETVTIMSRCAASPREKQLPVSCLYGSAGGDTT